MAVTHVSYIVIGSHQHIVAETKWPPFSDDIFKFVFLTENRCTLVQISMKFVRKDLIYFKAALFLLIAWRRTGDKLLSETMLA